MTTDSGSPDETEDPGELVEDDLPGFTPAPTPQEEIEALRQESQALRKADAEMDRWFEEDFGGMKALKYFLVEYDQGWDESRPSDIAKRFPELLVVVDLLALNPDIRFSIGEPRWSRLARETKVDFREISESLHLSLKETIGEEPAVDQKLTLDAPRETDRSDLFDDVPDKAFDAGRLVVPGEHIDIEPSGLGSAGPTISRWIWVGGGFGVIGLVLVVVFVVGGSDDPDVSLAPPIEAVAEETQESTVSAGVVETESPVAIEKLPATTLPPEPTTTTSTEPVMLVEGPGGYVTIVGITGLASPEGDLFVKLTPAIPWTATGPESEQTFWLSLFVTVTVDDEEHGVFWLQSLGSSLSEASLQIPDVPSASSRAEMYVTTEGDLVVGMPGEDGGLAADRVDPTAQNVSVSTTFVPEEGADRVETDDPGSLGEIIQVDGSWPPADWSELEVDKRGPVILEIPAG